MAINFWIKNISFPSKNLRIFKISHIFSSFFTLVLTRKWAAILKMENVLQ